MIIGSVAEILKYVLAAIEARARDPVNALTTHLDEALRITIHPVGHEMAADTGKRAGSLGNLGGGIVRAAGTKVRSPRRAADIDDIGLAIQQRVSPLSQIEALECFVEPARNNAGKLDR